MAANYNVKITFVPKYHCECNPIEAAWAYMKNHFRKYNDQDNKKFISLVNESRKKFEESNNVIKLWNRFFRVIDFYKKGLSYKQVLENLYGSQYKGDVKSHRKISKNIKK